MLDEVLRSLRTVYHTAGLGDLVIDRWSRTLPEVSLLYLVLAPGTGCVGGEKR